MRVFDAALARVVEGLTATGLGLYVCGVRKVEQLVAIQRLGAAGVLSDNPLAMLSYLEHADELMAEAV